MGLLYEVVSSLSPLVNKQELAPLVGRVLALRHWTDGPSSVWSMQMEIGWTEGGTGNEWGPSRAWVCPASSILRSTSPFISADICQCSTAAQHRGKRRASPRPHSWSRPPGPASRGTPPLPEAHPPACLLGQGFGDGVKVGFAAEKPMQKDEGRAGRLPVQKFVGKRHRPEREEQGWGQILSRMVKRCGGSGLRGGGPTRGRWGLRGWTGVGGLKDGLPPGALD